MQPSALFTLSCIVLGYLSGSVLYSRLYAALFHQKETYAQSADKNPGAFNAFAHGGFACGAFTVCGDVLKALLPVLFYMHYASHPDALQIALVSAAPVIGHLYTVFYQFHGGKGIAACFGSCAAMFFSGYSPIPLLALACLFVFFALIVRVRPNIYLTAIVYVLFPISLYVTRAPEGAMFFSLVVSANVLAKLLFSREPKPQLEVSFLCRR